MNRELTLFLALTKISVGNAEDLPYAPTEQEWKSLFSMANKHTIAGPLFAALDKLPAGQRPPRKVFVDWLATTEKIRHDSREATHNAIWTGKKFLQAGFRNVILKGQGNALLCCCDIPVMLMYGWKAHARRLSAMSGSSFHISVFSGWRWNFP